MPLPSHEYAGDQCQSEGRTICEVETREVGSCPFTTVKEVCVITKADCCAKPALRVIEAMPDESDAKVSIQKCDTCQTYWQVIADQVITDRGDMIVWDWYQPLTEEQAESVLMSMVPQ
jgi:hypothetical protein